LSSSTTRTCFAFNRPLPVRQRTSITHCNIEGRRKTNFNNGTS
jgi:hypothetical protein